MPFTEEFIDADEFRIRYLQSGVGDALVHIHGAGGVRLTQAHDLLSKHFRVIALERPTTPGMAQQRARGLARGH
ncbi:MAG TPA: hypothetical protein VK457_04905 [Chloroflexota bacterium]|jgi:hypothetical protein|nr:hypothetical protein [Chloroflexota bacterium]